MRIVEAVLLSGCLLWTASADAAVAVRSGEGPQPRAVAQQRLLGADGDRSSEQTASHETSSARDPLGGVLVTPLPNGNFESGAVIWDEVSLNGWNLILHYTDLPQGILPHAGNWATWLGGDLDEIAYIEQRVTVPVGSPVLKYWHWIDSEDDCGYDFAGVIVNSATVIDTYDLCWQSDTAGWVLHTVDMADYAGETLDLQIRMETDDQLISNLYVDDVTFESDASVIFADGFESGDTTDWSSSQN